MNPVKTAIVGGKKVSSKIGFIRSALGQFDFMLIGGAMANTFIAAQGHQIGDSYFEKDQIGNATLIMLEAKRKKTRIILPADFTGMTKNKQIETRELGQSLQDFTIYDIGEHTAQRFGTVIYFSDLIVWSGPMGMCEYQEFSYGNTAIVSSIVLRTEKGAKSIVGGGDTLNSIKGLSKSLFTHVSSSGSALLEWIAHRTLPGLDALRDLTNF